MTSVLEQRSDFVKAWSLLGMIHSDQGRLSEAVRCLAQAHYLSPLNASFLLDLAVVQKKAQLLQAALISLEKCNEISPGNSRILILLGELYWNEGYLDNALSAYRGALGVEPNNIGAMLGVALTLDDMGDTAKAEDLFRRVLALPDTSKSRRYKLNAASNLAKYSSTISEKEISYFADPENEPKEVILYKNAVAHMHHNQGNYTQAWKCLVEANELAKSTGQQFNEIHRSHQSLSLDYAKAQEPILGRQTQSGDAPNLIFILGASRSGKTTVEKYLSQDDQVKRGYEICVMDTVVLRISQVLGVPNAVDPWIINSVPEEIVRGVLTDYALSLANGKNYLTNTIPKGILHVGLIAKLLPNARFVFMKRNRLDQLFRIYQMNYSEGNNYSTDLSSIGEYLDWYDQMVDVWTAKFGDQCLSINYEELVEETESTLASVGKFTGIQPVSENFQIYDDRGCGLAYHEHLRELVD